MVEIMTVENRPSAAANAASVLIWLPTASGYQTFAW
jgi:hypothetical protein